MADDDDYQRIQQIRVWSNLYKAREDEGERGIVVMNCTNGRVLAHRNILEATNDYFLNLLSDHHPANEPTEVYIDTTQELMNIVVKCIYEQELPGRNEITATLTHEILIAAVKFKLKRLFEIYWGFYSTSINLDNFLDVWNTAEMYNATIENIRKFVWENMKEMSETDILSHLTVTQLDSIVSNTADKLEPEEFGDLIIFLVNWVAKDTSVREDKIKYAMKLISKGDISILPDFILREIMSNNEIVTNPTEISIILGNEVISRWTATKPRLQIHVFENHNRKWSRSIYNVNDDEWVLPTHKETKSLGSWFPSVSTNGSILYYSFNSVGRNKRGFVAYESGKTHVHDFEDFSLSQTPSETANFKEIFFKRSPDTYACFNTQLKTWRTVQFNDLMADCKCMLLATEGKYFFDLDERRIKIVDVVSGKCVIKDKLPGRWDSVKCNKSLCRRSTEKLIFFRRGVDSRFLIYNIRRDTWSVVAAPNIKGEVIMYVLYDDDCLFFEKANDGRDFFVYSMKTMEKVTEFREPYGRFDTEFVFDVCVK
uniref:BTB domain-containing protein n=1 Tax=Strigamia maritima TaxID=126957 RepID=T1JLS0_STRMM